jgi:hypothetical protein
MDSSGFNPAYTFIIAAVIFLSTAIFQYNSYIKQLRTPDRINKGQDKLSNTVKFIYGATAIIPIGVTLFMENNGK